MSVASLPRKVRIGVALRALRALKDNPDDTAQVFRLIEAVGGRAHGERLIARFRDRGRGRRLLAERPRLLEALSDRPRLEKLPEGTLGRCYLDFLRSEGITTEGLVAASVAGRGSDETHLPADLVYVRGRMRDMHDLWHVVTGYQGDLIGEAALLAFSYAQTRNPGVGLIVGLAWLKGRLPGARSFIVDGFRRGARARWLPVQNWEALLERPLDEVRAELGVGPPPKYEPYRSAQYRADMATA